MNGRNIFIKLYFVVYIYWEWITISTKNQNVQAAVHDNRYILQQHVNSIESICSDNELMFSTLICKSLPIARFRVPTFLLIFVGTSYRALGMSNFINIVNGPTMYHAPNCKIPHTIDQTTNFYSN